MSPREFADRIMLDDGLWSSFMKRCQVIARAGVYGHQSPETVAVAALRGMSMGLSVMESLELVKVIHGRPQIRGPQAVALVRARLPGVVMDCTESTPEAASWTMARPGGERRTFRATIGEARAADLLKSPVWKRHPARMLKWWAASQGTQELFGDVLTIAVTVEGEDAADTVPVSEPVVEVDRSLPLEAAGGIARVESAAESRGDAADAEVVTGPMRELAGLVADGSVASLADGRIRARSIKTDGGVRCMIEAQDAEGGAWRSIWYSGTVDPKDAKSVVHDAAIGVILSGIAEVETTGLSSRGDWRPA